MRLIVWFDPIRAVGTGSPPGPVIVTWSGVSESPWFSVVVTGPARRWAPVSSKTTHEPDPRVIVVSIGRAWLSAKSALPSVGAMRTANMTTASTSTTAETPSTASPARRRTEAGPGGPGSVVTTATLGQRR